MNDLHSKYAAYKLGAMLTSSAMSKESAGIKRLLNKLLKDSKSDKDIKRLSSQDFLNSVLLSSFRGAKAAKKLPELFDDYLTEDNMELLGALAGGTMALKNRTKKNLR